MGIENAKIIFKDEKDNVKFCENIEQAMQDANAVVIMTGWHQFKNIDLLNAKKILKILLFSIIGIYIRKNVLKGLGLDILGLEFNFNSHGLNTLSLDDIIL